MQADVRIDNGTATVRLSGRFDFNAHRDFRGAYEPLVENVAVKALTIDLEGVDYLDSSALGMLLILREKAKQGGKALTLANARAGVRQVLDIANFGKLFQFE